jgi:hypothetical protein
MSFQSVTWYRKSLQYLDAYSLGSGTNSIGSAGSRSRKKEKRKQRGAALVAGRRRLSISVNVDDGQLCRMRDSFKWEISTTYFTLATVLQVTVASLCLRRRQTWTRC